MILTGLTLKQEHDKGNPVAVSHCKIKYMNHTVNSAKTVDSEAHKCATNKLNALLHDFDKMNYMGKYSKLHHGNLHVVQCFCL